ncbi:myosin light chain 5-like [Oncorhynchus masou masou]|uniref:myosin light chain 5-like n=1 Tax=Oncorhynchus masou masou TaxID=90313 RepID=UPI003182C885
MRAQRASSNVFSMFKQTQIQEFKEVFTLIDQDRDGFIDKEDLKDTYESPGKLNVKNNELEDMLKEACSPINFTMFLNLFGEKLHRTDPEEIILNTFRMFNPDTKGYIKTRILYRYCTDICPQTFQVKQMFQSSTFDPAGNLDYKSLCYTITRGEEQEE